MDNKTYSKADAKQIPSLEFFVAKSGLDIPEKFRKKKVDKLPKKYMVWQAIWMWHIQQDVYNDHKNAS